MKKLICLLLVLCFVFALTACDNLIKPKETEEGETVTVEEFSAGKSTAANTFTLDGKDTVVAVDLTGSWSAEFGDTVVYLYDGANDGERLPVASGWMKAKQDYSECYESYKGFETFEEVENGFKVNDSEDSAIYMFAIGNGQYFMISSASVAHAESIFSRFYVAGAEIKEYSPVVDGIDYTVLVNKSNPLPEGWTEVMETAEITNSVGDTVTVEKDAAAAYNSLKADLEENDDVIIDVSTPPEETDDPEYQTGLVMDLYLNVDGEDVYDEDEMMDYPELWEQIHEKMTDYGFIVRNPEGKEHITGSAYQPWHIRYVGSAEAAADITSKGVALEEYAGAVSSADTVIDYGDSDVYDEDEIAEAMAVVMNRFAELEGFELHSIRYGGDDADSDENLAWLDTVGGDHYSNAMMFLTDFHSPEDAEGAWEQDFEYTDYQWWLAHTEGGDWEIVTFGY